MCDVLASLARSMTGRLKRNILYNVDDLNTLVMVTITSRIHVCVVANHVTVHVICTGTIALCAEGI